MKNAKLSPKQAYVNYLREYFDEQGFDRDKVDHALTNFGAALDDMVIELQELLEQ